MNQLAENLIRRLEDKGVSIIAIPRFVKDVAGAISINGHAGLDGMNRRLDLLGWGPVEVDYHTLQLIIASLENGGVTTIEEGLSRQASISDCHSGSVAERRDLQEAFKVEGARLQSTFPIQDLELNKGGSHAN
jgi:hypothetical protein